MASVMAVTVPEAMCQKLDALARRFNCMLEREQELELEMGAMDSEESFVNPDEAVERMLSGHSLGFQPDRAFDTLPVYQVCFDLRRHPKTGIFRSSQQQLSIEIQEAEAKSTRVVEVYVEMVGGNFRRDVVAKQECCLRLRFWTNEERPVFLSSVFWPSGGCMVDKNGMPVTIENGRYLSDPPERHQNPRCWCRIWSGGRSRASRWHSASLGSGRLVSGGHTSSMAGRLQLLRVACGKLAAYVRRKFQIPSCWWQTWWAIGMRSEHDYQQVEGGESRASTQRCKAVDPLLCVLPSGATFLSRDAGSCSGREHRPGKNQREGIPGGWGRRRRGMWRVSHMWPSCSFLAGWRGVWKLLHGALISE